jgi:hypothetical protein
MATPNQFQGFEYPTTTPVPDEIFDVLLPQLSGAEVKVLLYICRRTLGFKKQSDNISLHQIATGITTKDGRVLDRGTGLCKAAVVSAVRSLEKKGIISKTRRQSLENGCEATTYSLNFAPLSNNQSLSKDSTGGCLKTKQGGVQQSSQGLVQKLDTQQTVIQETERQETDIVVDVVAKQLETFGIAKACATKLTQSFPAAYIREKLAMAQELVRSGSCLIAKNPAGWLRRAIEEDYVLARTSHSHGSGRLPFSRGHRQQKGKAALQRPQPVPTDMDEREQTGAPECLQPVTTQEQEPPSRENETTWNNTLQILKEQVPAPTFKTWLKDTMLLALSNGVAKIKVPTSLAATWLERRLYWGIVRALRDVLQYEVADVQFVTA